MLVDITENRVLFTDVPCATLFGQVFGERDVRGLQNAENFSPIKHARTII